MAEIAGASWVLALAALVSAAVVLYRFILKPASGAVYRLILLPFFERVIVPIASFKSLSGQISEVQQVLAQVRAELLPNGGGSLRDALNRIEVNQSIMGQRIRGLFSEHEHGVFEASSSGDWIWANKTLCRILGRPQTELLQSNWIKAVSSGPEGESALRNWFNAVKYGREFEERFNMVREGGELVRVLVSAHVLRDDKSNFSGFLGRVSIVEAPLDH